MKSTLTKSFLFFLTITSLTMKSSMAGVISSGGSVGKSFQCQVLKKYGGGFSFDIYVFNFKKRDMFAELYVEEDGHKENNGYVNLKSHDNMLFEDSPGHLRNKMMIILDSVHDLYEKNLTVAKVYPNGPQVPLVRDIARLKSVPYLEAVCFR